MSLFNSQAAKEASKTNVNYGSKRRDESRLRDVSLFCVCSNTKREMSFIDYCMFKGKSDLFSPHCYFTSNYL